MTYLVDIIIVLIIIYGSVISYRRGFLAVTFNILTLVAGLVVAAVLYRPLAEWVLGFYKTLPAIMNVVSYLWILLLTQFVLLYGSRHLIRKVPHKVVLSKANQVGGAFMGGLQMVVFLAIGLMLFMSLPVTSASKERISSAVSSKPLLELGDRFETLLANTPGKDFTQTLNLLMVKPESDKSVELGFATTDVKPKPELEARMLELVNGERTSRGLKALRPHETARAVARKHSVDMFARGYFAHKNPDGLDPFDRMKNGGVVFTSAGENLALAPTLKQAHVGLMNSPGHRANILSADYGAVGIGVIDGGPYGLMITQNFTN